MVILSTKSLKLQQQEKEIEVNKYKKKYFQHYLGIQYGMAGVCDVGAARMVKRRRECEEQA